MVARDIGTIRGYELGEPIGQGGFGAVHRGYQPVVDREVAIKVILPEYANDPDFVRTFEAEARLIARLEHPYIVPLYDYWREPEGAYLVMRYFPAGSLLRLLQEGGPMPPERVAEVLVQIGGALDAAHRHRVIHRDIKPENILMDGDGNAYLADFGIAKHLDNPDDEKEGSFRGTLLYAAPELLKRKPATPQSDIYGLGFVAYEMLTGEHPFSNATRVMVIRWHMERELPRIAGMSDALMATLWKATAKAAEQRYMTARDLARDFQLALNTPTNDQFNGFSFDEPPSHEEPVNPYKGLRAFDEADAADFFGRNALVEQMLDRLTPGKRWHNFLAVVGPSGSGKSSVVLAGLVPAIRAGKLPDSEKWFIVTMTPGSQPFQQLTTALLSIAIDPTDTVSGKLRSSPKGLIRVLEDVLHIEQDVLLVIDQFEEVFTLVEDDTERQQFLQSLVAAVTALGSKLHVVLTLRADFYDKPLLFEHFGALVQARTQVVLPLSAQELEQAISGPARRVGLEFDADLVAAVVADVRREPGALPLLQYALTEVYEQREGRRLTLASYHNSGRVLGALARRAEEVYSGLPGEQQPVAQQVFLRLVALGDGTEDTRRRVRYSELAALKVPPQTLQAVLDAFGRYRLLTFDRDGATREPTVEVAHEALIREWDRLRDWLDNNREHIRLQRLLMSAATDWRNARGDKSYLLRGARLAQFEDWSNHAHVALSDEEQRYLDASLQENKRQRAHEAKRQARELALERRGRRRLQAIVGILIVASIIGISLTLLIYRESRAAGAERDRAQVERDRAEQERDRAEEQQALAERQYAEANSLRLGTLAQQAFSDGNTVGALGLAMQAVSIDDPPKEVIDTLIDVAYAPGLRRVIAAHDQPIIALAISPDAHYVLSATGNTRWMGGFGGPSQQQNGPPDGSPPPDAILPPTAQPQTNNGQLPPPSQPPVDPLQANGGQLPPPTQPPLALNIPSTQLPPTREAPPGGPPPGGQHPPRQGPPPSGAAKMQSDDPRGNHSLVLWDATTGQEARVLTDQSAPFTDLVFLPSNADSPLAISASVDGLIALWDVVSGRTINQFDVPPSEAITLSLSRDGSRLLVVSSAGENQEGSQLLWDVANWQKLRDISFGEPGLRAGALTPDGLTAVSSYENGLQIVWDTETGQERRRFTPQFDHMKLPAYRPSMSTDGTTEILNIGEPDVPLFDITTGESTGNLQAGTVTTLSTLLTRDASQALIVARDGVLRLWDVNDGSTIRELVSRSTTFESAAMSQDGRFAVTGTTVGTLYFWDLEPTPIRELQASESGEIKQAAFLPGGSQIITFGPQMGAPQPTTRIAVWNTLTGQIVRSFGTGQRYMPMVMAVSPDGRRALTGTMADVPGMPRDPNHNDAVILSDVETGAEIWRQETANNVTTLAFDPLSGADGRPYRALIPDGNGFELWRFDAGEIVRHFEGHSDRVEGLAFSPNGDTIASIGRDGKLRLWNPETGALNADINIGHGSPVLVFSPNGQTVAIEENNGIALWDVTSGRQVMQLEGHENHVTCFAFSADGTRALSGSADNTIILWDLTTGEIIHRYDEPNTIVWQVAFSPDRRTFLSGADRLMLWRADDITLDEVRGWISVNRYLPDGS